MKRILISMAALIGLASAASAVPTVVVSADQATYNPGAVITLTVAVDDDGVQDTAIFGQLLYNPLMTFQSSSQNALSSFGGFLPWSIGVLTSGVGFADAFNQLGNLTPVPVDQAPGFVIATLTFVAGATAGTVNVGWNPVPGANQFDFFGLSNGTGTSFNIVPEPTTAALLGLGLFGLALTGRRRS